ncbi:MAG TPA: DUF4126 domain-containing protein [Candidatus Stackebrandtia excrementipullorum]|nr:DUF4126 domain-containing protein [Candidatus Stackebrandtia excrementipullorum]
MFAYLTAAGLSASAGLNAYIPLLVVGLFSRFTDAVRVPDAFGWLTDWWALCGMTLLLLVELVVDKVPIVDHVNDILQTVVRPAAGGMVAAATASAAELDEATGTFLATTDTWTGWIVGGGIALIVHVAKALTRTMINGGTLGFGAPVASTVEDAGSAGLSVLAVVVPILAGIALIFLAILLWRLWLARRRRRRRRTLRRAAKQQQYGAAAPPP